MIRLTISLLLLLLVGCYDSADKPTIDPILPRATTTIGRLRSEVVGNRGCSIYDDIVVHGRVVNSDVEDNYFGSVVVQDVDGALEIMAGLPTLTSLYPEGLYVAVALKGCYAAYGRGVLQVGIEPPSYSYYAVGNLASQEMLDRVLLRSSDVGRVEPTVCSIAELRAEMCGKLITVQDLRLVESTSIDTLAGQTLDDAIWRGYQLFKDAAGDSIAVFTRDRARYVDRAVPRGLVDITGILEWSKYDGKSECYHLKMRYEEDCVAL